MKTLLPLLALLFLCTGCVTSRTPVGSKPATLDPKVWNAKWLNADGGTLRTRIADPRLGIIRISPSKGPLRDDGSRDILVRQLGLTTVANQQYGSVYKFARIDATTNHLLLFEPDQGVFVRLIDLGLVRGKADSYTKGKPTGNLAIEGLSDRELRRIAGQGIDLRTLFQENPSTVLIRYRWTPF